MSLRLKIALYLNFFIIAVLLSSMGVVVMGMVNEFGISKTDASILEIFKDATIILSAFLVSSFIPRLGYKKTLLIAPIVMGMSCVIMPTLNSFGAAKVMFAMTGFSFMLIKVVSYSLIGLYSPNDKHYRSSMGTLEGFFSFSMLIGISLFGMFIFLKELSHGGIFSYGWINTYWLLAVICLISFVLVSSCSIDESKIKKYAHPLRDIHAMCLLLKKPAVITFVFCIFIYGFLEQAVTTWLPKLYNDVFTLSESAAVFLAGTWPLSIALGRFAGSWIMHYIHWLKALVFGLFIAIALMISVSIMVKLNPIGVPITLPFTNINIPLAAFLLPMLGLFIGAVYPTISASILSSLKKSKHSSMTGWTIIFSSLGGATGSRVMAIFYQNFSGVDAISMLVYPIVFLLIALLIFAYFKK